MIVGLDHIAVAVRDFEGAVAGYRTLLGRAPDLQPGGGAQRAWFRFPNAALEVVAAEGDGPTADRVNRQIETHGEGIWLVAFGVADVSAATRLLERRGLRVEPVADSTFVEAAGLTFVMCPQRRTETSLALGDGAVAALDHVVVHTPNPDRAVGVYGAKLGLDLRLDRANAKWGARQLFFRCGDAVFEVGASLKAPAGDGPDGFGGLAWRVDDPEAARARMAAAGFDVSEVRAGRKPGTKVFTVRDAPAGVPTLMLSAERAPEPA